MRRVRSRPRASSSRWRLLSGTPAALATCWTCCGLRGSGSRCPRRRRRIKGTAVTLPIVSYLGQRFRAGVLPRLTAPAVRPAAERRRTRSIRPACRGAGRRPGPAAAALHRDRAECGRTESVPVYPQGVSYLAADDDASDMDRISVRPLPVRPGRLLAGIAAGLIAIAVVRDASAAWLSVAVRGRGPAHLGDARRPRRRRRPGPGRRARSSGRPGRPRRRTPASRSTSRSPARASPTTSTSVRRSQARSTGATASTASGAATGLALLRRAARFRALITPDTDARTIDELIPTPHSTRSPISISR